MTPAQETSERELLACPFCGGEAAHGSVRYGEKTVAFQRWDQDTFFKVNCIICGADNLGVVGHTSPDEAAEAWNTRAAGDAVAWHDISTAPKDGSNVLVHGDMFRHAIAYWGNWRDNIREEDCEGWLELGSYDKVPDATHWQPLPAAPATPRPARGTESSAPGNGSAA